MGNLSFETWLDWIGFPPVSQAGGKDWLGNTSMKKSLLWGIVSSLVFSVLIASPAIAQENGWNPTSGSPAPSELSEENLPELGGPPSEGTSEEKPVDGSGSGSRRKKSEKKSLMKVSWKELKEYQGKVGDKSWKALFRAFGNSWGKKEDDKWAAEQRNRYDVFLFGKKYKNVAGHKTKVSQLKQGKPKTSFDIELLTDGIKLSGKYSQTFNLISITGQIWAGPVPVVLKAESAASFGVKATTLLGSPFEFNGNAWAGIGVDLTAAVGFVFGYIGVKGSMDLIQAELYLDTSFNFMESEHWIQSGFSISSSGKISIVAKVAFAKKTYPIWKSPSYDWYYKTLLDMEF